MVSPFAADDDQDGTFPPAEDVVTSPDNDEPAGPQAEFQVDDTEVNVIADDAGDDNAVAPARPVPTHLRALPPAEPPTGESK